MNEKFEFVFVLFDHSIDPSKMNLKEAQDDIDRFSREGWDIPEGLDAESYMGIWNSLVEG